MTTGIPDSLERLSHTDLIGVVRELIGEVGRLRTENEKLSGALTKLKVEHQAVKDELARLKNLPPRPPQKPSGMDKATDRGVSGGAGAKSPAGEKSSRRRGSQLDKLTIDATVVVRAKAPAGSRHKGYEEIVVQDLNLSPQVTLYCRERWETPEGERIIAALDPGIVGGYGPNLHRFVLALHFSGQVTCERIVALLNGMGVLISKRQVVRLLTAKLETFRAEDEAVLKAGLGGAYVTVDDTGARHAGKSGYPTQIGSDTFTVFRTGPSKSRLAFLSRLCGGTTLYVINDAALDYIPRSRHDPKILSVDDAEIVGDRIAEVRPVPWNGFTQKTKRRIGELGAGCIAFVVRDVSVHEAPQPLDRIEMRTIGRDEMQLDPAAGSSKPFLHELGVMIARVVEKDMDERQHRIKQLDRFQEPDRRDGVDG